MKIVMIESCVCVIAIFICLAVIVFSSKNHGTGFKEFQTKSRFGQGGRLGYGSTTKFGEKRGSSSASLVNTAVIFWAITLCCWISNWIYLLYLLRTGFDADTSVGDNDSSISV